MSFTWSWSAIECFEVCPLQYYHKYVLREKEIPTPPALEKGIKVHAVLEQIMKSDTPSSIPLVESVRKAKYGKKLYVELKMGLQGNFEPCGFFDDNVWGRNAVDVGLIAYPNAIIVDWKTGKVRDKEGQLMVCSAFMFAHFPKVETITSFNVFIEHNKRGEVFQYRREQLPQLWAQLLPRIEPIEKAVRENKFCMKPGPLCKWCPVLTCPNNKR